MADDPPEAYPFIPTQQLNLLIHGAQPIERADVPPGIQVVTFMDVGQILSFKAAEDITFWLNNSAEYSQKRDLKQEDSKKFKMEDSTVRVRVYNPGESCPNYSLSWNKGILGFYNTYSAYIKHSPGCLDFGGKLEGLTLDFIKSLDVKPHKPIPFQAVLDWLGEKADRRGQKIRLYLLACSDVIPGEQLQLENVAKQEPEGGWPDLVNVLHGGHRKSRRRRRKTRVKALRRYSRRNA